MTSGIYAITNTANGKRYVGSTKNFQRRWKTHLRALRLGSHWNIKLQRAFNKHGEGVFTFEVLEQLVYDASIVKHEDRWMMLLDSKINGYNIASASFGDILTHHPDRDNIRARIGAGLRRSAEALGVEGRRQLYGKNGERNGMYGKKRPQQVVDAMKNGTRRFIDAHGHGPNKGYTRSPEVRAGDSTRAQLRIGPLNSFYGKKHNDSTIATIRAKAIGRVPSNAKPVSVNGIVYSCVRVAEQSTGIKAQTLRHRALSNNPRFDTIFFVTTS